MEAMAVEMLVDAYYQLKGYWTKLRYPIKTDKGAWSDIDVLAYNPVKKELVICECKAKRGKDVLISTDDKKLYKYADEFINNFDLYLKKEYSDRESIIQNKLIDKIQLILVGNFYEKGKKLKDIEKEFDEKLKKKFNENNIEVCFEIKLTIDVICETFKEIKDDKEHNKRYGHSILDFVREINRYLHPNIKNHDIFHSKFINALELDFNTVNKK